MKFGAILLKHNGKDNRYVDMIISICICHFKLFDTGKTIEILGRLEHNGQKNIQITVDESCNSWQAGIEAVIGARDLNRYVAICYAGQITNKVKLKSKL